MVEPESASEIKAQHSKPMLTKCAAHKVTFFITSFVPSAYLKAETPRELHYILPMNEVSGGLDFLKSGWIKRKRHRNESRN